MDVLKAQSKLMTGLLGRCLEKILQRKFCKTARMNLHSLSLESGESNTVIYINAAISVPTSDLEALIKKNMF